MSNLPALFEINLMNWKSSLKIKLKWKLVKFGHDTFRVFPD